MSSKSIAGHRKSGQGSGVSFHSRLSLRNFRSGREERQCSGFGTPLCSGQFRPVPPDQRVKQGQCALGSEPALARASIQPMLAPLRGADLRGRGGEAEALLTRISPVFTWVQEERRPYHRIWAPAEHIPNSRCQGKRLPLPQSSHLLQESSFTLFLCYQLDP